VKVISKGRLGAILAMSVMMLIAAQPAFAATTKFGAKVANGVFPSNAYPGTYCDHEIDGGSDTYGCTWILLTAYNGGSVTAQKNGTINKVRIINGHSGSFKVVIASKNASGQFKVTARSAKVNYTTDPCNVDCVVHTYNITPLTVKTGQYVGIQTPKTSTLRCDSGGNKTALLTPPLAPGGAYTTPDDYSGCFLLVQAVYAS
jgi:hypothetical protein